MARRAMAGIPADPEGHPVELSVAVGLMGHETRLDDPLQEVVDTEPPVEAPALEALRPHRDAMSDPTRLLLDVLDGKAGQEAAESMLEDAPEPQEGETEEEVLKALEARVYAWLANAVAEKRIGEEE